MPDTNDTQSDTTPAFSRRRFVGAAAGAAIPTVIPSSVIGGGKKKKPPSERLNIAGVGLGARGLVDLERCRGEHIAALCDVDWKTARVAFERFPGATRYRDFRKMLDAEASVDAVVVATPDHTHAVITAAAMKHKKHVYTEMPLAHDVWEARRLAAIARETGVITQMGNARHSAPTIRRACHAIWGGSLGAVGAVHCWTNRPQWPQGKAAARKTGPMPEGMDWDRWLGPAPERPYSPAYHPYRWRGWLDFGTGALGAMGCHVMDGPFWALGLAEAPSFTVTAESTGITGGAWPRAATIRYRFPAAGDRPALTLTWYDGGRKPKPPKGFPTEIRGIGSNGSIFVGEEHTMIFGAATAGTLPGQAGPRTIPEFENLKSTKKHEKIPGVKDKHGWQSGSRHQQEWIAACKTGKQPCANFDYAGPLTEMVLLGNVALQAGAPIEWDAERGKASGAPGVDRLIRREYREGWRL